MMARRLLRGTLVTTLMVSGAVPIASGPSRSAETAATDSVAADSLAAAGADSAAVPVPLYRSSPAGRALTSFRLEWSADVEETAFGDPDDPTGPLGFLSLADLLRLSPEVRTRELSQGPTVETFGLRGTGSGRADLIMGGTSLVVPGTSGPQSHEIVMSELAGFRILRGGGAALYGPTALTGAVVLDPRFPFPDELTTRAVAEEGVDGYQRGGFTLSRPLGRDAALHLGTESRRIDGFFDGTKEVDRHFDGEVRGRLPAGWEGTFGYRRWQGDGRSGGMDPDLPTRSILAKRGDWRASLFRPSGEDRGALLELSVLRERIENLGGGEPDLTREIMTPTLRLTGDLPSASGWDVVGRVESTHWRIEREEEGAVDRFWRGAAGLRASRGFGIGTRLVATGRADTEEDRRRALHGRLEGEWSRGPAGVFGILSRGERVPDRGAAGSSNEVSNSVEAGVRWAAGPTRVRAVAFGNRIHGFRRDPTFEEIQARQAVLDAPIGTAEILGATIGLETDPFRPPGLTALGLLRLRTSFTGQRAELAGTGEDLPGRPRRVWTGEGWLERHFFKDELRARVCGRLTHWGDRGGTTIFGEDPIGIWITDVILEGKIGDAVFFYRFHDMLERADDPEPGYRFPGFSRMYGISWRFVG